MTGASENCANCCSSRTGQEWAYWVVACIVAAALPFLPRILDPGSSTVLGHNLQFQDHVTSRGELLWSAAIVCFALVVQAALDCPDTAKPWFVIAATFWLVLAVVAATQVNQLVSLGWVFWPSLVVYLLAVVISFVRLVLFLQIPAELR